MTDAIEPSQNTKKIWVNLEKPTKKSTTKSEKTREKRVDTKEISQPRTWTSNIQLGYDRKDRVVVDSKRWTNLLGTISKDQIQDPELQYQSLSEESPLVKEQIHSKIKGYRYQDILKGLLNETELVDDEYVIRLLHQCKLKCFYCHIECMILYPHVREPKQWTLERINNDLGHNRGNVQIACLECNLRRRTIHHERYIETKKIANIRKIMDEPELDPPS